MIYFAVTGVAFPFIYGGNELIASIARFAIAYLSFLVAAGLEAIICTTPAGLDYDAALIDDNETRLGAADGASAVDLGACSCTRSAARFLDQSQPRLTRSAAALRLPFSQERLRPSALRAARLLRRPSYAFGIAPSPECARPVTTASRPFVGVCCPETLSSNCPPFSRVPART